MTRSLPAAALALALAAAPVPSTGGWSTADAAPARLSQWQVQRAGSRRGGVCAYYSGYRRLGSRRNKAVFRRRACFPSRAQCFRWLYWAQSYYPIRELRKGCRG